MRSRCGWRLRGGISALLLAGCLSVSAQEIRREVLVPFEDLDLLLESGTRRVLMDRDAFDALRARAEAEAEIAPPLQAMLLSAEYQVSVEQERAEIRGLLRVESLHPGTHLIPLPLSGVGLRSLRAADRPVPVGRMDDGSLAMVVQEPGEWEFTLDAVAPLQSGAAQQVLQLKLPTPASARMHLVVPGDVEVRSGAAVMRREFLEDRQITEFDLLLPRDDLHLVMSLNSRLRQQQRVVVASGMLIAQITRGTERLQARYSMDVLHRPVDRFTFSVPEDFTVTSVQTPNLAQWRLLEQDGRSVLEVLLQRETTEPAVISIAAVRENPSMEAWQFPRLEPLDVAGSVAVIGIQTEPRLTVRNLTSTGLIPIDRALISRAFLPGDESVRAAAGYYAPSPDFDLSGSFVARPAVHDVTTHARLHVARHGLNASGGFVVRPREESLYEVAFSAPNGWEITAVHDENGQPLPFDVLSADEQGQRIRVPLPNPVAAGAESTILYEAQSTPDGWLDPWEEIPVDLPVFAVEGADRDLGAVLITAEDDLEIQPLLLQGLSPLDAANRADFGIDEAFGHGLAFRYSGRPYEARIGVRRLAPRAAAETITFYRFDRQAVRVHHELLLSLEQGRTRTAAFRVPADTPALIAIRGLDGASVRETTVREDAGEREWTVHLAENHAGRIRLAATYEVSAEPNEDGLLRLPTIRAVDVRYQSGLVAVEGDPELNVRVAEHPRPVDIGELAQAQYEPGKRLLGAYAYVGDPPPIVLEVRRPTLAALPSAIVDHARVLSTVSSRAVCQSAATFALRSRVSYLALELPRDTTLWSVRYGDTPLLPQQLDNQILLDLPAQASAGPVDLVVVYESRIRPFGSKGHIRIEAPRLFLPRQVDSPAVEIAVAQLHWQFYAPDGYRVVHSGGSVSATSPPRRELAAARVARLCTHLAGGVNPDHGLIRIVLAPLKQVFADMGSSLGGKGRGYVVAESAAPMASYDDSDQMESMATFGDADRDAPGGPRLEAAPAAPAPRPTRRTPQEEVATAGGVKQPDLPQATRSLEIEVAALGARSDYYSLGVAPRLVVDIVHKRRIGAVQAGMGLAVLVGGVALLRANRRWRWLYVLAVLVGATLLAAVPGSPRWIPVWNSAFYAGCLLPPFYLALWVLAALARRYTTPLFRRWFPAATAALLVLAMAPTASSQNDDRRPVPVPDNVSVIPYDANTTIRPDPDRLLVPYEQYRKLWSLAHPDQTSIQEPPPLPYAWSGGRYQARLEPNQLLTVLGELTVQVYAVEPMEIPLLLQDVLLGDTRLNGKPALLRAESPPDAPMTQAAQQQVQFAPPSLYWLYVPGPGVHRLALEARIRLERRGGWRIAAARLPVAPATEFVIEAPDADTEVVIRNSSDQSRFVTREAQGVIRTALGADGLLNLEWRPFVAERTDEQSLTAESSAVFDIQEDHLRLLWDLHIQWRGGERDAFELALPADYLVENVTGENVQGWSRDPDSSALSVQLLKPVADRTSFRIQLQAPGVGIGQDPVEVEVPAILLPGAIRHTGRLLVRRGPMLELRLHDSEGARRLDLTQEALQATLTADLPVSPLGITPFQLYEFVALPYSLRFQTASLSPEITAHTQTLLRLSERERRVESRLELDISERPLYELVVQAPADLVIDGVAAPGAYEWDLGDPNPDRRLTVRFAEGLQGEVSLVLQGRLGGDESRTEIPIPGIQVISASTQTGEIAIQTDPAHDVELEGLDQLEPMLLHRVHAWVDPASHPLVRVALRYTDPAIAGTARLIPRRSQVSADSVTNVRVTDRTIEQTSLLRFSILDAGVRAVEFDLPLDQAQARIRTPHLRQKTLARVPETDWVRVRLDLQDAVIEELMVLIESDRLLESGSHAIRPPVIRTGSTHARYLVLESAGRDEVVVEEMTGLTPVARRSQDWAKVEDLLRGGAAEAFRVEPGAGDPSLSIRTRVREVVETAGARIGLARTTLILDEHGAYRARQVYYLYNRTEPALAVELPAGAVPWTARVAGEPVKPLASDPEHPHTVQIPLIRTETGDLDYQVEILYGGSIRSPGATHRTRFPLPRAVNVGVDLTQVEVFLPRSHHWPRFTGTLDPVRDAGDLEAGLLAYQNKTLERLTHTLQYGNAFERARAGWNIKDLNQRQLTLSSQAANLFNQNARISEEVNKAQALAQEVQQHLGESRLDQDADTTNRGNLLQQYQTQDNRFSQSALPMQRMNWDPSSQTALTGQDFERKDNLQNPEWLLSNSLVTSDQVAQVWAAREGSGSAVSTDERSGEVADLNQVQSQLARLGKAAFKGQPDEPTPSPEDTSRRSQQQLAFDYSRRLDALAQSQPQQTRAPARQAGTQSENGMLPPQDGEFEFRFSGDRQDDSYGLFEARSSRGVSGVSGRLGGGAFAAPSTSPSHPTGLAGLDVDLPEPDPLYWSAFRFSSPGAANALTAYSISHQAIQGWQRVGLAIAAILIAWWIARVARGQRLSPTQRFSICNITIILGAVGLLFGFLPFASLALIFAAFLTKSRSRYVLSS